MRKLSYASLVALVGGLLIVAATADAKQAGKTGTIKGQVVFAGSSIPEPKQLNVTKDQQHCLGKGPIVSEEWVINKNNKGIKNVFVWLTTTSGGSPPVPANLKTPKQKVVELDQPTCAFVPHALAMREGQTLDVKNTAPVAHNINWKGSPVKNPGGNVIVPPGKDHKVTNLKADKLPISVTCNIHTWMSGWIRVFDHPYYAVTDENGNFEIADAPTGDFHIMYWHDTGYKGGAAGRNGDKITIKAGQNDLGKVEWKP